MTLIKSISGIRGTIGGAPGEGLSPLDIVKFTYAYCEKRWQEYIEELCKKDLHDLDNHDSMSTSWIPRWCDHSPRARHPGT